MNVELLRYDEPETVARAARLCYSDSNIDDLFEEMDENRCKKLTRKLADRGHLSPFEHCSYTFGIEGISRSTANQLVRHRIASYSQKSQRYVKEDGFDYVTPPSIEKNDNNKIYDDLMAEISKTYNQLIDNGVKPEDARYVLPNGCETKIIATFNIRSLDNFFEKRMCNRAQWEIRNLANEMYSLVYDTAPYIFENMGAPCKKYNKCLEGDMSCTNK